MDGLYPVFRTMREKGKGGKVEPLSAPKAVDHDGRAVPRLGPETFFGLFIIVVFIVALWHSRDFGFRAGLFPWVIGFPVLILSVIQLVRDLMGKGGKVKGIVLKS